MSRLKWVGHVERMGDEKWQREAQKVDGKGGEEDRECDGRTALREMCHEWEENIEQHKELETGDRERSERKSEQRKEKTKKR